MTTAPVIAVATGESSIEKTTIVITTSTNITTSKTTEIPTSQRMFYTRSTDSSSSYGDIYDYVIDDLDGPQMKRKFKISGGPEKGCRDVFYFLLSN